MSKKNYFVYFSVKKCIQFYTFFEVNLQIDLIKINITETIVVQSRGISILVPNKNGFEQGVHG